MRAPVSFTIQVGSSRLEIVMVDTGEGLSVTIVGGTAPHIGAVALAVAHPSPSDPDRPSATVSTVQVPGHKDGLVAGPVAEQLARQTRRTVSVAAGIHIGPPGEYHASPEEIRKIIEAIPRVVEAILERIE